MEFVKSLKYAKLIKYIFFALMGSILFFIFKSQNTFLSCTYDNANFCGFIHWDSFWMELGIATISLYLFEGIIGLPVFSGSPEKALD